jgi:hypothetical protein
LDFSFRFPGGSFFDFSVSFGRSMARPAFPSGYFRTHVMDVLLLYVAFGPDIGGIAFSLWPLSIPKEQMECPDVVLDNIRYICHDAFPLAILCAIIRHEYFSHSSL